MLETIIAFVILVSLILYPLMGGADYGGGIWDLYSRGPRADRQRRLIAEPIAPIWEANHVWLCLGALAGGSIRVAKTQVTTGFLCPAGRPPGNVCRSHPLVGAAFIGRDKCLRLPRPRRVVAPSVPEDSVSRPQQVISQTPS